MKQKPPRRGPLSRLLLNLHSSPGARSRVVPPLLLLGLAIFTAAQGALSLVPLWTQGSFTEVDDILGYICKTRQMEECFFQDCPALVDLREQLLAPSPDPDITKERYLASTRVLPVYHFLLSGLLLLITKFGPDLFLAYKLLWSITPFLFGLAFLYLLTVVWGREAAGIGLMLLAFKVFPDTGLHLTVPSNLAMGLAAALWARIISRRGRAPLALVLGTLALITLHPAGRVYAVMGFVFALALAENRRSPRVWGPIAGAAALVLLGFVLSSLVERPYLFNEPLFPPGQNPLLSMIKGAGASVVEIASNIVRLEEGLFGQWPIFYGALALGFLTASPARRSVAWKISGIYLLFLTALLFYGPTQPADGFLRLWIPLVVLLFGAAAQAVWFCLVGAWDFMIAAVKKPGATLEINRIWPVVALAVLLGYSQQMTSRGAEQILAMITHLRDRMPIALADSGPEKLRAEAHPGDKVLYDSIIVMPFYLSQGALSQGAVYYHSAMKDDAQTGKWLAEPSLRFAALYNPLVRHPSFQGRQEHRWWPSAPDLRYSPISARRTNVPMLKEGFLDASDYFWLELGPRAGGPNRALHLLIKNPGQAVSLSLYPVNEDGRPLVEKKLVHSLPANADGWIKVDLAPLGEFKKLRLSCDGKLKIGGLTLDESGLNWPWLSRADLVLKSRDPRTGRISVSFDPARLLPPPLDQRAIKVLDDHGSSVLLELGAR
ncbi:MAG: hypothetical protein V1816_20220 [Pseudomonadota bacterium]